jgi:hypothetical protein
LQNLHSEFKFMGQLPSLLTPLVCLSFATGILAIVPPTFAQPSPVFRNIIASARQQLPKGLQLRLPASIPTEDTVLHAFIKSKPDNLQVFLSTSPDCREPNCSVGGIAMFDSESFAKWEQKSKDATPVSLPKGITGYYLNMNNARYIFWRQDSTGYLIGISDRVISQSQLEAIAVSTVNEPPIR